MRNLLIVLIFAGFASSVAASDTYLEGDNFLECLVGKGAVAMRHGAKPAEAVDMVSDVCMTTLEPEPASGEEPEGDWGDYVDYIYSVAVSILDAGHDAGAL